MSSNNYLNNRTLLIAGAVVVVGSAFIIYQLSKSKDSANDESVQTTIKSNKHEETNIDSKEEEMKSYAHMHAATAATTFPIKVFVRVRAMKAEEINSKEKTMDWIEKKINYDDVDVSFQIKTSVRKNFPSTFAKIQKIAKNDSKNDQFFESVIESTVLKDYNIIGPNSKSDNTMCIFNYGHIGSGRGYTMLGSANNEENSIGMYYLTGEMIFKQLKLMKTNLVVKMEYFEINYDLDCKLRDLLVNTGDDDVKNEPELYVGEDSNGVIQIKKRLRGAAAIAARDNNKNNKNNNNNTNQGLSCIYPNNANEIMKAINEANGRREAMYVKRTQDWEASKSNGSGGDTKKKKSQKFDGNQLKYDSRLYHTFLVFEFVNKESGLTSSSNDCARIVFIGLAPSNEYLKETKKIGKWRKVDTTTDAQKKVNESLINFKEFIQHMREENSEVYYADMLCKVMKKFVSKEKSKAMMIANVSPLRDHVKQNINTLKYSETLAVV